jgi:2-dehydro-3-deoxyphosphogluconate aldolase/(4S)-4-hydroxy-2-oxoglutarate aldolase
VVRHCVDNAVPIIPGVATPTDIETALGFGLSVVKFFPAEAFGGVKTLKAIAAPFGMMRFVPTGGIDAGNLRQYLDIPNVLAVGGSWMVKSELIKAGKFEEIAALTRQAVQIAKPGAENR